MWARRDWAVARLAPFLVCLLCAGFAPVAAAAIPSWRKERPLPQAAGGGARVAITSTGDVAVAWRDAEQGLSVALRPAGGRFGSPQRLSRSGRWVESLDVVADSRGALVVVWVDGECCRVPADKRVWASTREPGGGFSPPVALSEPLSDLETTLPALAAGNDGSVTVVWPLGIWSSEGLPGAVIEAADRPPGGGFGPPTPVSAPDGRPFSPVVPAARAAKRSCCGPLLRPVHLSPAATSCWPPRDSPAAALEHQSWSPSQKGPSAGRGG